MVQHYPKREGENSIEQYLADEFRKLEVNLRKAWSLFDEAAIHDFRVSLKKLRAVMAFIKKYGLSKQEFGSFLKGLKPVFKSGGRLRDLQVNHQLIRDYEKKSGNNFVSFRAFISREILLVEEDFKHISKKAIQLSEKLEQSDLLNGVKAKENEIQNASKIFLGKSFKKASRILLSDIPEKARFHRIRKILKKARFVFEMNLDQEGSTMDHYAHLNSLKDLESILGTWHDSISFQVELKSYLGGMNDPEADYPEIYQALLLQIESDIHEKLLGFEDLFMKEYHWFLQLSYRLD